MYCSIKFSCSVFLVPKDTRVLCSSRRELSDEGLIAPLGIENKGVLTCLFLNVLAVGNYFGSHCIGPGPIAGGCRGMSSVHGSRTAARISSSRP